MFPSLPLPLTLSPALWPQWFRAQPAGPGLVPSIMPLQQAGLGCFLGGPRAAWTAVIPSQALVGTDRPWLWAQGGRGNSVLHGKSGAATLRAVGGESER